MKIKKIVIAAAIGATVFATAACGSSSTTANSIATTPAAVSTSMSDSAPVTSDSMSSSAGAASDLVGSGCAAYAAANPSGAGSVGGMAQAKVAEAATANPLLTSLVAAVSGKLNPKVNLVDTLDGGQFTVFAPVDDAFKKLDAATIDKLKIDDALLSKILTYHVIVGQLSPTAVVGTHKTVEGGEVTVTGSGDSLKVNNSTVICGGVKTANATVYLIDTVLTPPAS